MNIEKSSDYLLTLEDGRKAVYDFPETRAVLSEVATTLVNDYLSRGGKVETLRPGRRD